MADRARLLCASLLVVTAVLFVIGTSVEKGSHAGVTDVSGGESAEPTAHTEAGESSEARDEDHESGEAKVLGTDRESAAVTTLAVLASIVLAALVWFRPRREVWIAIVVVGLLFAVFDIAEVRHQLDESASGLAVLAGVIAAGHLAVAGIGAARVRS